MKFGVREICDVVLKAKANQVVGNKKFYKGEPVIYFDTLKTSSMEGAATTVYAQGGRGNSRLVAWEGERTITFTMEDALISPAGFMILSGAGLIDGSNQTIQVHVAEQTDKIYVDSITAPTKVYIVTDKALSEDEVNATIYAMPIEDGEIITEPYIGQVCTGSSISSISGYTQEKAAEIVANLAEAAGNRKVIEISAIADDASTADINEKYSPTELIKFYNAGVAMVDYYTDKKAGTQQIEITPDKFGGNYYLEASTLFRDTNGVDMPAEFIIPNCKIQSNFTFTMASSGDPSTFTFTMDAFPDYTRFNRTKKVLAAIQIVSEKGDDNAVIRNNTPSQHDVSLFN